MDRTLEFHYLADQKPDRSGEYIVCRRGHAVCMKGWFDDDGRGFVYRDVYAWAKMPEAVPEG